MMNATFITAPAKKRAGRAPRRFTAVHILPANSVPDVSGLLIQFFGPALKTVMAEHVARKNSAALALVHNNNDLI